MAHMKEEEVLFLFECPICEAYKVSLATALKFLTPDLRRNLKERISGGSVGAKLKFRGRGCPKCVPNGSHEVELAILERRIH